VSRGALRRSAGRVGGWIPGSVRAAFRGITTDDTFILAAGLAFYALVSVVPLTIVVLWLTGLLVGDDEVHRTATTIARLAPRNFGADRALIRVAELGTTLGVTALLSALWPATSYGSGLRRAFVRMSRSKRRESMQGFRGRGLLVLVLIPPLVLGSLAGALVVTGIFRQGVDPSLAWLVGLFGGFLAVALATLVIYRVFPVEPPDWASNVRASLFAAGGVMLLALLLALVVGLGADFEEHYAVSSLAGLVLLAVWLFLSNILLLAGYRMVRPPR
jgi:membrane protein